MRAHLSRRYHVSASHRLHSEAYDDARNRAVYGKCNNPFGHGHNYTIEVTVAGPVNAETGMVMNLVDLDGCVRREVVEQFDHTNLSLHDSFRHLVPTTENFCIEIYNRLIATLRPAELVRVRVEETENNFFEYAGGLASSAAH